MGSMGQSWCWWSVPHLPRLDLPDFTSRKHVVAAQAAQAAIPEPHLSDQLVNHTPNASCLCLERSHHISR
jgi:hypothetical protein